MQTIECFENYQSLAVLVREMVKLVDHLSYYESVTAIIKAWQLGDMLELMLPHATLAQLDVNPYDFPMDDIVVTLDADRALWAQSAYLRNGDSVIHETSHLWIYEDCHAKALGRMICVDSAIFSLGGDCNTN